MFLPFELCYGGSIAISDSPGTRQRTTYVVAGASLLRSCLFLERIGGMRFSGDKSRIYGGLLVRPEESLVSALKWSGVRGFYDRSVRLPRSPLQT